VLLDVIIIMATGGEEGVAQEHATVKSRRSSQIALWVSHLSNLTRTRKSKEPVAEVANSQGHLILACMARVLRAERERGVGCDSGRGGAIASSSVFSSFTQTSLLLLSAAAVWRVCAAVWGVCVGSVCGECGEYVQQCGECVQQCGECVQQCGECVQQCGESVQQCGESVQQCGESVQQCGECVQVNIIRSC